MARVNCYRRRRATASALGVSHTPSGLARFAELHVQDGLHALELAGRAGRRRSVDLAGQAQQGPSGEPPAIVVDPPRRQRRTLDQPLEAEPGDQQRRVLEPVDPTRRERQDRAQVLRLCLAEAGPRLAGEPHASGRRVGGSSSSRWPLDAELDDPALEGVASDPEEPCGADDVTGGGQRLDTQATFGVLEVEVFKDELGHL